MASRDRQLEVVVSQDCIFCRIASGALPVVPVYQSDEVLAIQDINPQAPTHLLIMPREHVSGILQIDPDTAVWRALLRAVQEIAASAPVAGGFRLVVNNGPDGGQTVDHLHIHMLGGRPLLWPPG